MERSNAVSKTLKAREGALSRAEEKINTLTDRIARLEAEIQSNRAAEEKRVEDLNSALNRERMERAVAEGALEASRKDFARLQREMMALNASQRRSTTPLAVNPAIAHDPAEGGADTPKGKISRRPTQATSGEPIVKN
jgi:crescentin